MLDFPSSQQTGSPRLNRPQTDFLLLILPILPVAIAELERSRYTDDSPSLKGFRMRRLLVVGLLSLCAACRGIQPSPTAPAAGSLVAPVVPTRVLVVPGPGELPVGGGTARLWIEVSDGSRGAPNVPVTLQVSEGVLEASQVVTDSTGHVTVQWAVTKTATVTATAGELVATETIKVASPYVPPPPSPEPPPPPPPPPPAPPAPAPPVVPSLSVTLTPASGAIATGVAQTYTAAPASLDPGETVVAYQWEFEAGATATTTTPTRSFTYTTHGIKKPSVTILSSSGRTATGNSSVVVTSPLR